MHYQSTSIRYDRTGDKLHRVRYTKEWLVVGNRRAFVTTRIEELGYTFHFEHLSSASYWPETPTVDTRHSLMQSGAIKEAGHGMPCLTLYP